MNRVLSLSMRAVVLAVVLGASSAQAAEPMVVPVKRMSLETALKAAQAAIGACRADGLQVGVTVLDRSGQIQAQLRDVLAPDLTLRVSQAKAYTAVSFNAVTSTLSAQGASGLANVPGVLFQAGGVPIAAGGTLYGAIGVSGAPLGSRDEACAQAGVKAVVDDLEMQ